MPPTPGIGQLNALRTARHHYKSYCVTKDDVSCNYIGMYYYHTQLHTYYGKTKKKKTRAHLFTQSITHAFTHSYLY